MFFIRRNNNGGNAMPAGANLGNLGPLLGGLSGGAGISGEVPGFDGLS